MKLHVIGDVHGKWLEYRSLIEQIDGWSIQVGDFGVGFEDQGESLQWPFQGVKGTHKFIRGNHDNPEKCKNMPQWIDDGTCHNGLMCIGGAHSIDQDRRIEGVSWWRDEELSYSQLTDLIPIYQLYKPEIMITHDAPDSVARTLFSNHYHEAENKSRTRQAFDTMFHHTGHRPKYWVFGHWHQSRDQNIMGTQFICLNELECRELFI